MRLFLLEKIKISSGDQIWLIYEQALRAYRVARSEQMSDLGPVFPPVGIVVSVIPEVTEITYPLTFWYKPVSNFGL